MSALQQKLAALFTAKRFNLIAFGIITALILIAYSNTFTATFHFDDNPAIVENSSIKRVTWDNFVGMLHGTRPIVNLSLMFNYAVSGLNVVGWHIFNVSCHIANSIFVYLFILWTLTLPLLEQRFGYRARRMALFGALLFGLHPIQTESVTYIISRTELIATFFYLATFLFFIKGVRSGKFGYTVASFFTAVLAMGSKEWAVTLPAMLLLYDFLFLAERRVKAVLGRWTNHFAVILSWGVLVYTLTTTPLSGAGFGIAGQNNITPWTYLLTSLNVLWTYIRLLFLPINQNLDYEFPLSRTLFEFPTLLSLAGHVAVALIGLWLYRKKGWTLIPYGIAWFYITLSPTQSFVPILDVIFEHRLYLPSIGFFLVFIAGLEGIFDALDGRKTDQPAAAAARAS
jgi:hypothetical protein